jgi:hypothetical protein
MRQKSPGIDKCVLIGKSSTYDCFPIQIGDNNVRGSASLGGRSSLKVSAEKETFSILDIETLAAVSAIVKHAHLKGASFTLFNCRRSGVTSAGPNYRESVWR